MVMKTKFGFTTILLVTLISLFVLEQSGTKGDAQTINRRIVTKELSTEFIINIKKTNSISVFDTLKQLSDSIDNINHKIDSAKTISKCRLSILKSQQRTIITQCKQIDTLLTSIR